MRQRNPSADYPHIAYLPDPTVKGRRKWSWTVCDPWTARLNGHVLHVPAGFRTDLASIPRILWILPGFAPMELGGGAPPIVHDWLYQHGGVCWRPRMAAVQFTRRQVDSVFLHLMQDMQVGWRRFVAWWAVRLFGWFAWRKAV